ncbi:MAG: S46 family peptidase [Porphyromonas sp.]|nr:S46 family peptidase [Porphyromonas sp.]
MKKLTGLCLLLALGLSLPSAKADEGMWLLPLLKQQNYARMQELGLQLTADEIYNDRGESALFDAVVHFGGGCTGEIVSPNGLLFTNHHCGYGEIQSHSSIGHNYLRDGFYAPTLADELPNPGLTVTFTEEIVDVTDFVGTYLSAYKVTDPMIYLTRSFLRVVAESWYHENRGDIEQAKSNGYQLDLAPIYAGNKFILYVQRVYRDVRLVAAPPSFIGSFGSDTDNWTWPRHSGDFSIFRVYTAPDGSPADYSAENVPLKPKTYFKVSTKGVEEDDFVMIIGFPGTTRHFSTAAEVTEFCNISEQIRIDMREVRQEVLWQEMMQDEKVEIQYAAKYKGSTNAYKRAIGNNWAAEKIGFEALKQSDMDELRAYAIANNRLEYIEAMDQLTDLIGKRAPALSLRTLLDEGIWRPIEILRLAPIVNQEQFEILKQDSAQLEAFLEAYDARYNKDYNSAVDRRVTKAMVKAFRAAAPEVDFLNDADSDVDGYVDHLFDTTIYRSRDKLRRAIEEGTFQEYELDPLVQLHREYVETNNSVIGELNTYTPLLAAAQMAYQKGMLEMKGELNLWPDANSTLRYTFGQVRGYSPRDQVFYGFQTTLDGVFEKEDPNSEEYYILPPLRAIYERASYGDLALKNGQMPVNFCATTHTTGGNSGSPVLNAEGHLVGLNFDRNWEGVGGDLVYLPDFQRSIICDVRYLLLILDQYLGADRLLDELSLAN